VSDSVSRCECMVCGCKSELVDSPSNWDICEYCQANVCNGCLIAHHGDNCEEKDDEGEEDLEA